MVETRCELKIGEQERKGEEEKEKSGKSKRRSNTIRVEEDRGVPFIERAKVGPL